MEDQLEEAQEGHRRLELVLSSARSDCQALKKSLEASGQGMARMAQERREAALRLAKKDGDIDALGRRLVEEASVRENLEARLGGLQADNDCLREALLEARQNRKPEHGEEEQEEEEEDRGNPEGRLDLRAQIVGSRRRRRRREGGEWSSKRGKRRKRGGEWRYKFAN